MSDLIEKQTALDAIQKRADRVDSVHSAFREGLIIAYSLVQEIPSAEPERTAKVKHLERRSETSMSWEGICTNCGAYTMHEMRYCFHCGCRMEWE